MCSSAGKEDVDNIFRAIVEHTEGDTNGAPRERPDSVKKESVLKLLQDEFNLEVDIDDVLGIKGGEVIDKAALSEFLTIEAR